MGPWLVFAALINRATIALYNDAPVGETFGRFVQDAKVTMLGVVPTLVRTWRASRCMEDCDWSSVRCLSSTGEASNPEDMFYLSWLAGFKPIIEYCGGTEIGGAYISSSVVQPNVAGLFPRPRLAAASSLHNTTKKRRQATRSRNRMKARCSWCRQRWGFRRHCSIEIIMPPITKACPVGRQGKYCVGMVTAFAACGEILASSLRPAVVSMTP